MKQGRKQYLLYSGIVIAIGGLAYILFETIRAKNTGFETKSLWDWMELFVVPFVLALGAFILNSSEKKLERESLEERAKLEREITKNRQQETTLHAYFDKIGKLLIENKLSFQADKNAREIARVWTLTTLRELDQERKRYVLLFLWEARLINFDKDNNGRIDYKSKPIISLDGADFTDANLSNIDIYWANLGGANFSRANLEGSSFDGSSFVSAILVNANLRGADFAGDFGPGLPTIIKNADLSFANLDETHITKEQLEQVKSLSGAAMPDRTIHE